MQNVDELSDDDLVKQPQSVTKKGTASSASAAAEPKATKPKSVLSGYIFEAGDRHNGEYLTPHTAELLLQEKEKERARAKAALKRPAAAMRRPAAKEEAAEAAEPEDEEVLVKRRPAARVAVPEEEEEEGGAEPVVKRKAAAGPGTLKVYKSLYKRNGIWGIKVDQKQLLQAGFKAKLLV